MISLRGSDATHTLVLLDDIPLNDAASGLVDLSTIQGPGFGYRLETIARKLPPPVVEYGSCQENR